MAKSRTVALVAVLVLAGSWVAFQLTGTQPALAPAGTAAMSQPTSRPANEHPTAGEAQVAAVLAAPSGSGRLSAAQERETLAFLREKHPASLPRLAKQKNTDPAAYNGAMARIYRFMKWRQEQPKELRDAIDREKAAQLAVMKTARQIRREQDPGRKANLAKKLREAVAVHFDLQQELREARLAWLERQISDLRSELKDQQAQRGGIIRERIARWMKAARPVEAAARGTPTTQPASN